MTAIEPGTRALTEAAARVLHAWDVENGPCEGRWDDLTPEQRDLWRSGARALAAAGLLRVPEEVEEPPLGSVVLIFGEEGTSYQRAFVDGLWHSPWARYLTWPQLLELDKSGRPPIVLHRGGAS